MTGSTVCHVRARIRGELSAKWWSAVFTGLAVELEPDGTTLICGDLPDQTALHGMLAAIRDLGLTLVSIETSTPADAEPGTRRDRSRRADRPHDGSRPGRRLAR